MKTEKANTYRHHCMYVITEIAGNKFTIEANHTNKKPPEIGDILINECFICPNCDNPVTDTAKCIFCGYERNE